jgi:hypothetical protein
VRIVPTLAAHSRPTVTGFAAAFGAGQGRNKP